MPTGDAVTACATAIGPNRAHYATTDTVADLEDLRAALGAERWSLNGVSYGSYVAQRYAAAHPDRVDRLVLDSVVPMTGFDPLLTDVYPEVARVLRAVCATASCAGDPADALNATVRRWPDLSPVLLDVVTGMSVADPTLPGLIPALFQSAAGQDQAIRSFAASWQAADTTDATSLSQGLHASTLCLDLDFPWGGADTDPAARAATVEARVAGRPGRPAVPVRRDRRPRQRRGRDLPGLADDAGHVVDRRRDRRPGRAREVRTTNPDPRGRPRPLHAAGVGPGHRSRHAGEQAGRRARRGSLGPVPWRSRRRRRGHRLPADALSDPASTGRPTRIPRPVRSSRLGAPSDT